MKHIKKIIFAIIFTVAIQIVNASPLFDQAQILAWDGSKCTYEGQCVENYQCHQVGGIWIQGTSCGSAVIGGIRPPQGVSDYNSIAQFGGGDNTIGVFAFISVGLRLFTILCGLFMFFNFLWAGYSLITRAGDSKAYTDVRERLSFAMIGLVVVVAAYMLAAMIGLIFFGDATFILKPDITQFGATAP